MNDPLSFRSRSVLLALVALLQVGCERPTAPPPDVTPPAVALASPAGDTVVSAASLTLSGTLTDSVGVRQATCELNEGRERELAITPGASASFSATVTLRPGPNTLRVDAYDAAGNRGSSARVGVTMDTLPPAHLPLPARRIAGDTTWQASWGMDPSRAVPYQLSSWVGTPSRRWVTAKGAGYCWGSNLSGELGTGSPSESVPAPVSRGLRFTRIRSQGSHTCGVTQNGAAYCWGYGLNGQLGNGTHFNASVPVRVLDPM